MGDSLLIVNVYCIYFPNGKRYVGVESRSGRRISEHARCVSLRRKGQSPQAVDAAINCYEWKNCRWRYLATNCSYEDGWALEIFFIKTMGLQDPQLGYNRHAGGKSPNAYTIYSQTRVERTNATRRKNGTHIPHHMHTPERRAKAVATRKKNGSYRWPPSARRNKGVNSGSFQKGLTPWNKDKPYPSKSKGKIVLPAGPNGEPRFFRPEQMI